MGKKSAGLLLFRYNEKILELFLVHPGGPFYAKKDLGAWSIPKGEFTEEEPIEAAKREFEEETGIRAEGEFIPLTPVKQSRKKTIFAWTLEHDCDASSIKSNTFEMEWPPKSGRYQEFPEIDKAEWFEINDAKEKIVKGQLALIDELIRKLNYSQKTEGRSTISNKNDGSE